jgi:hypothetical protein
MCYTTVYHAPYAIQCQKYAYIGSLGCVLPPACPDRVPPHSDPHTLTRPPSLTPSPSHLGLVKRIVELGEKIRHSPQSLHDMKFRPNAKSETAVARYASERAETGSRRRGLQRSIGRSERGPDGSNPGRPAGESNPIAWPKPEARHRSRASWKMHARIDSRQQ